MPVLPLMAHLTCITLGFPNSCHHRVLYNHLLMSENWVSQFNRSTYAYCMIWLWRYMNMPLRRTHDWQEKMDYMKRNLCICHLVHHRSIIKNPGIEIGYSTVRSVESVLFTLKQRTIWISGDINICNDKTYCFVQNFRVFNYSTLAKKYVFRGIRFITIFNKSGHFFSPLFTGCFHKMKSLLSLHVCQGLP